MFLNKYLFFKLWCCGRDRMVVGFLPLSVKSVHITTKFMSLNPVCNFGIQYKENTKALNHMIKKNQTVETKEHEGLHKITLVLGHK